MGVTENGLLHQFITSLMGTRMIDHKIFEDFGPGSPFSNPDGSEQTRHVSPFRAGKSDTCCGPSCCLDTRMPICSSATKISQVGSKVPQSMCVYHTYTYMYTEREKKTTNPLLGIPIIRIPMMGWMAIHPIILRLQNAQHHRRIWGFP